jgi:GntR family transcriptional regulator
MSAWNDSTPIYLQIREKIAGMLLDGLIREGDAIPSVRQFAADYQVNPLTVSRAYQQLVDEGVVEVRRGLGMFVRDGAVQKLREAERVRFLEKEWPAMLARAQALGLNVEDLLKAWQKEMP